MRLGVLLLLALHVALVVPGMLRNSVTFDENFHLPAGVLYLERGYTHVSVGQPPLARALYALPVVVQRPVLPPDSILTINAERAMGLSFQKLNAARFQRLYLSARLVALLLSLLTGLLIFRLARELYGRAAGLLALGVWVAFPEVVAQAGVVGMDLPTALVYLLLVMSLRAVVRRAGPIQIALLTLSLGAALLTRFSSLQMAPVLAVLVGWRAWQRRTDRPWYLAWALLVAGVGAFVLLDLGYLAQVSMLPMGKRMVLSHGFKAFAARYPNLVLPLPDAYIAGFDFLRTITEAVSRPIYLLGKIRPDSVWWYFPLAAAVKWPLGMLGLLGLRLAFTLRHRVRRAWDEACLLLPAGAVIGVAMLSDLDYGVRYLLPALPFLCVWLGGLLARPVRRLLHSAPARGWAAAAALLVVIEIGECALAGPWQLSFFNALAGGRGDWFLNDSNVDWGQGLIALRDEMKARGIRRVLLTYHGTSDPALYGIDYVPYLGGPMGPESDWLAVSDYFYAGLSQRMVTPTGDSPWFQVNFTALNSLPVAARPANCMRLIRLR